MIGMIAAVSVNGVIGLDNKLPFDYPADMKHFRTTTAGSTVIMGRKTWEGIGRPLPKRRNIIVTRSTNVIPGVELAISLDAAMTLAKSPLPGIVEMESEGGPTVKTAQPNIWLIGGASIYEEGMEFADQIVLTLTPDTIKGNAESNVVRFPWINPSKFTLQAAVRPLLLDDPTCPLKIACYVRV